MIIFKYVDQKVEATWLKELKRNTYIYVRDKRDTFVRLLCVMPFTIIMTPELEEFLKNEYDSISINYSDFKIAKSSSFDDLQEGYRLNSARNESFIGTRRGDWKDQWFVVGFLAGDPVFVDISDNSVYTSMHGTGSWDQEKICESLGDFKKLLDQLKSVAIDRENPVKFEKNPIAKRDLALYMSVISRTNAKPNFWMQFVQ